MKSEGQLIYGVVGHDRTIQMTKAIEYTSRIIQPQIAQSFMTGLTGALLEQAQMQSHGQTMRKLMRLGKARVFLHVVGAVLHKNGLGVLVACAKTRPLCWNPSWNWKLVEKTKHHKTHTQTDRQTHTHNAVIVCFSTS